MASVFCNATFNVTELQDWLTDALSNAAAWGTVAWVQTLMAGALIVLIAQRIEHHHRAVQEADQAAREATKETMTFVPAAPQRLETAVWGMESCVAPDAGVARATHILEPLDHHQEAGTRTKFVPRSWSRSLCAPARPSTCSRAMPS